jgi:adenylate cyclase
MIESVNRHHGIVNKFLGDGFMAVFGAPISNENDCKNAVRAAREILSRLEEMCASGRLPPTQVGMGLHAGSVVTGSIGSAERKEYTIIGDVVNVASRIEGKNRELRAQILISRSVFDALDEAEQRAAICRGPVVLKGRQKAIELYQLG